MSCLKDKIHQLNLEIVNKQKELKRKYNKREAFAEKYLAYVCNQLSILLGVDICVELELTYKCYNIFSSFIVYFFKLKNDKIIYIYAFNNSLGPPKLRFSMDGLIHKFYFKNGVIVSTDNTTKLHWSSFPKKLKEIDKLIIQETLLKFLYKESNKII